MFVIGLKSNDDDHTMFSSKHKYNSGTGWPSFYQAAIEGNVATNIDRKYGLTRTEVHCAKVRSGLFKTYLHSLHLSSAKHILVTSSMMVLNRLTCVIVSTVSLWNFILINNDRFISSNIHRYIYICRIFSFTIQHRTKKYTRRRRRRGEEKKVIANENILKKRMQ